MRRPNTMLTRSRSDPCLHDSSPQPDTPSSFPLPSTISRPCPGDFASLLPLDVPVKVDGSGSRSGFSDMYNGNVGEYYAQQGLRIPGKDSERKSKSQVCLSPITGDRRRVQDKDNREQHRRPSPLNFLGFDLGLDIDLQSHFSFAKVNDWNTGYNGKEVGHEKKTSGMKQRECTDDMKDRDSFIEKESKEETNFEPFCRICTCTEKEDSSSKLIRPCRCSGTNSYVHISCLQQWRATSARANDACPGTWKYIFQFKNILLH